MALPPLKFDIDGNLTPFLAKMEIASATVIGHAARMGTAFVGVSNRIGGIAKKVGLIGGLLGGVAVKSASSFSKEMSLAFTQTDLTQEAFSGLTKEIRAAAVEFGATDLTAIGTATFDAFSTGAETAAEAADIVITSMEAAAGATIELDEAVKFVTQQWISFQPEARDARKELDLLLATVAGGAGTAGQFATAFSNVSASSASFGLSQSEMAAGVAELSRHLGGASKGATAWKALLTGLQRPTTKQTEFVDALNASILENSGLNEGSIATYGSLEGALEAMNIDLLDFSKAGVEAAGGIGPFLVSATSLIEKAQETGLNVRSLIEDTEGFEAIMSLVADNAQGFVKQIESIGDSAGTTAANFVTASDEFDQKVKVLIATGKELGLTLIDDTGFMDELGEMVDAGAEKIRGWVDDVKLAIEENPGLIQGWIDGTIEAGKWTIGIIAATTAIAGLSSGINIAIAAYGLLALIVGATTAPVVAIVVVGVAAMVAAWVFFEDEIKAVAVKIAIVMIDVMETFDFVMDAVKAAVGTAILWVLDQFERFPGDMLSLGGFIFDAIIWPFKKAWEYITDLFGGLDDWFAGLFEGIFDGLTFGAFSDGGPVEGFADGGPVQSFSSGGSVSGPAGLDVIPAKLTDGEFVINATSAGVIGGDLLEALNKIGQGGTSSSPLIGSLVFGGGGGGSQIDETTIREQFLPELERLAERMLSPRGRSVL